MKCPVAFMKPAASDYEVGKRTGVDLGLFRAG